MEYCLPRYCYSEMNSFSSDNITTDNSTSAFLTPEWVTNEYISLILVAVLVPFILCSNILVIFCVVKFRRLQVPTNFFIVSLATADIVIAITLPVYVIFELTPLQVIDDTSCLAAHRFMMTAGGVSILTLATIAYDRYIAIGYPLKYIQLMKRKKVFGMVLFSWTYSIIVCWIPVSLGWHGHVYHHALLCTDNVLDRQSRLLFLCAIFVPACAFILIYYFKIYRIARHHAHAIAAQENSIKNALERQFVKTDTKYAKTIGIIISVFLCLWLPYQVCLLVAYIGCKEQHMWVNNYLMLFAFLNSGVNPWVYAYKNNDFRSAYKKFWKSFKSGRRSPNEDKRASIASTVNVLPDAETFSRLDRANSRVLTSDIIFVLSQQMGNDNVEYALNRRLSDRDCDLTAVNSLPDLLKIYATTHASPESDPCSTTEVVEIHNHDAKLDIKLKCDKVNQDSAYSDLSICSDKQVTTIEIEYET
ncbi:Serpentine type 7TM GPCR chemoreceptor Srx [Mactra antiquata]